MPALPGSRTSAQITRAVVRDARRRSSRPPEQVVQVDVEEAADRDDALRGDRSAQRGDRGVLDEQPRDPGLVDGLAQRGVLLAGGLGGEHLHHAAGGAAPRSAPWRPRRGTAGARPGATGEPPCRLDASALRVRGDGHGGRHRTAGPASGRSRRVDVLGQVGLGGLDERGEGRRVVDGQVGQDLAVDLDTRGLEALDEAVVGQAVGAGAGVDALDPELAEVALAFLRSL